MATGAGVYNRGKVILGGKSVTAGPHVWGTTAVGILLVDGTYTPSLSHNFVSDVSGDELSGHGYARITTMANQSISEDDTANDAEYLATKTTFAAILATSVQPEYAIVFDNTGASDAAKELLAYHGLGASPTAPNGNQYEVRWGGTDGIGVVFRMKQP